jgi:N utilization substance protein B
MEHNPHHDFDWESGEDAFPHHDKPLVADSRTEARIALVQLAAQGLLLNTPCAVCRESFTQHIARRKLDKKLFALLADDLCAAQTRYTQLVQAQFKENWPWARTNVALRGVLLAASAELTIQPTLPTGVIVEEYMNIAKGFLPPEEVAFVRATLEKLVALIRA